MAQRQLAHPCCVSSIGQSVFWDMGLEFTWHYFTKINFSVDSKLVLLGWQNNRDLNQVSGSSLATVKPSAWRDLDVDSVAAFSRDGQFLAAITEERTEIYSTSDPASTPPLTRP